MAYINTMLCTVYFTHFQALACYSADSSAFSTVVTHFVGLNLGNTAAILGKNKYNLTRKLHWVLIMSVLVRWLRYFDAPIGAVIISLCLAFWKEMLIKCDTFNNFFSMYKCSDSLLIEISVTQDGSHRFSCVSWRNKKHTNQWNIGTQGIPVAMMEIGVVRVDFLWIN